MITPKNWHHSTKDYANYSKKNKQHHNLLNQKSTCKALQLSSRTLTKTTTTSKQQSYYHMKQLSRNRKLPRSNDTSSPLTKPLVKRSLARMLALTYRFSRNYANS